MNNKNDTNDIISGLDDIPDRSEAVGTHTREIETDLDQIEDTYKNVRQRAEDGIEEQYSWQKLKKQDAEQKTIPVASSLDKLDSGDFPTETESTIDIEADTRHDYVRQLVNKAQEKESIKEEIEGRLDSVKGFSDEALEEFLHSTRGLDRYDSPKDALEGSWGEKLDQELKMTEGKKETQRLLEEIVDRAEAEKKAIENELERTVDQYTDEIYDQTLSISKRLGGKGRSYTGELDLLDQISRTRASVIENMLDEEEYTHSNDEVAQQEGALKEGKRAMEAQAALIADYVKNADSAKNDAKNVIEEASEVLDDEELAYARNNVEAIGEGLSEFSNAFEDECYDDMAAAIEATMRYGMMDDEELETSYSFTFEDVSSFGAQNESQA